MSWVNRLFKLSADRTTLTMAPQVTGVTFPIEEIITVPLSFETNFVTASVKVYFPYKVTINKIRTCVTKALAGVSSGYVTCGNSTGASTGGVVTIAASAALGEEDTASPTTNNVVLADGYYYLVPTKANVGGEALVTLEFTRTV